MAHKFQTPSIVYAGREAHEQLKDLDILEDRKHALFIIDSSKVDQDIEARVKRDVQALGIKISEFREVGNRVNTDQLDACIKVFNEAGADVVIAMGGIGAVQTGKLVGLWATNGGAIKNYKGANTSKHPPLPVIAVGMSAGSGAAIANCACFVDSKTRDNCCVHDKNLIPAAAFLDPGLTAWQSPKETACDGVLSLAYAVESVTSDLATPVTDACALAAIGMTVRWLPVAYSNGHDLNAREQIMYGQQLVSMAKCNCHSSIICKIAGQIETHTYIPFGDAVAAVLPWLLGAYEEVVPGKVNSIRQVVGSDGIPPLDKSGPISTVELFRRFLEQVDLSTRLSFLGMEEAAIPVVTKAVLDNELPEHTPITVDDQMISDLLRKAF